jgi:hypothetical protein
MADLLFFGTWTMVHRLLTTYIGILASGAISARQIRLLKIYNNRQ